VRVIGGSEWI